jgi:hypothetical protein
MAIAETDIASIFTGMDLGAEKIAENFNKLLEENIDQDKQLGTLNSNALQIGNFIGKDNPDLNNITMGAHNFGFWEDSKVPANSNWPKAIQGTAEWGWILQLGNDTTSKVQLICSTGGWMFMRIRAGARWDTWTVVQTKYEQ